MEGTRNIDRYRQNTRVFTDYDYAEEGQDRCYIQTHTNTLLRRVLQ